MIDKKIMALNGICPYFTMFPLDFPYAVLSTQAKPAEWVIDPFCGRGTTNYASRILGHPSIGIDSNPVAAALAQAKLANTSPSLIMRIAQRLLDEVPEPSDVPQGEFWEWAFHRNVLLTLCRLREGLLRNCHSDTRKALRAIIMGGLHGPRQKLQSSYFSNQSPRTYAPKPRYAVQFWKKHDLWPHEVDVLHIIRLRAERYYGQEKTRGIGHIIVGDSRERGVYTRVKANSRIRWVITSPPYYGMYTYLPDQWLRSWFLGGMAEVNYSHDGQLSHASPEVFATQLKAVWENVGAICQPQAKLVIRFGAIHDRKLDSITLIQQSLQDSGWVTTGIQSAGSAAKGKRQARHFLQKEQKFAIEEYDVWSEWQG
jgi:DNA methylase